MVEAYCLTLGAASLADDKSPSFPDGAGVCLAAVQKFCRIVLELFCPAPRLVFTEKMARG